MLANSALLEKRRRGLVPFLLEEVRIALVLEQLAVSFLPPVERHAHLPGPREHLRVLDRDFVEHVIGAGRRVALDDVQRVAVEIPGPIEPGPVVEMDHIDDERVPLPAAARVAHPPVDRPTGMRVPVHVDVANGVQILVEDGDLVGLLNDLKRIRHVGDARHSGKVALGLRIERRALVEVLLLLRERRRLVGDGAPFHHAVPGGHAEARADGPRCPTRPC